MRILIIFSLLLINTFSFASVCKTHRQVFIENAETKVWKSTICPHEKLPLHSHDFARVVIPEEDGQLQVVYQSGKMAVIELHRHKPSFLSIAQGREMHQDENTGRKPLHVMVIELKSDNQNCDRKSPAS